MTRQETFVEAGGIRESLKVKIGLPSGTPLPVLQHEWQNAPVLQCWGVELVGSVAGGIHTRNTHKTTADANLDSMTCYVPRRCRYNGQAAFQWLTSSHLVRDSQRVPGSGERGRYESGQKPDSSQERVHF